MKILINILFVFIIINAQAQCPQMDFTISKDTVCLNDTVLVVKKNPDYLYNDWEFNSTNPLSNISFSSKLNIPTNVFNYIASITIVKDSANWYGFVMNYSSSSIIMLDFGSNLENINPQVTNIGNPDTALLPEPHNNLGFVKKENSWFAYSMSGGNNDKLLLFDFGSSLKNVPIIEEIDSYGMSSLTRCFQLLFSGDTTFIVAGNWNSKVVVYGLKDSINQLSDTSSFYVDQGGGNGLFSISIKRHCNKWYGIACNYSNNKIYKLNFGNSLFNKPKIEVIGMIANAADVELIFEDNQWVALTLSRTNGIKRIGLGANIDSIIYDTLLLGDQGILKDQYTGEWVKENGNGYYFTVSAGQNFISIIKFSNNDKDKYNSVFSKNMDSVNVIYNTPGMYFVSLDVIDSIGNYIGMIDTIVVENYPEADFYFNNTCTGDTAVFQAINGKEYSYNKSYNWNFNFVDTSDLKNPNYVFPDTGVYNVILKIESNCGTDSIVSEISIINKPNAKFEEINPCSSVPIYYYNSTQYDTLINYWSWQFGDGITSIFQNPSHLYSDTGKFQITFITGVEGCTDTIIDTITFYPKPVANFNSTDICIGDSTKFNDSSSVYLSSLTPVNKWNWNFGDSNTDSNQIPKHLYVDSGKYSVRLIVTTTKNCSDTITQSIDIQKPLAKFVIKEKICDNFPIPFIDTSTVNADSIISWKWAFVSGDSSALQYPTYSFPDSGIFNIYLKVKSSQNCTHDTVIPIYVNLGPTVAFLFDTVCAESPASFSDNSTIVPSDTVISWAWDFGDSSAIDNSQSTQHIYSDGAQYSVTLNVATQKGCKGIKINNIIAKPLPAVNFGYSTVCVNNNVNFYDFSSVNNVINDSIVSWNWFFDDGNSSTSQNPVNLYTSSTTKNVLLIAYTNNNCFDSLIKPVIINPLPVIDYTYSEVCEPETTTFLSSSSLYNLFWTFGDPTSGNKNKSTDLNPTHIYKNAGSYFVNLIAVSSDNCTTNVNKTISVSYIPVSNFTTDSICKIYPANFFDSSFVTQASIAKWKWDFDDGTQIDTSQNPIHSYSDTGKYTVNLFVFSEKGCSSEISKNVQVYQLPDAKFDFTPQFGIPPLNVSFKNKTNEAISYKWYFGDGYTSLDANTSHTYTDTGEYTIKFYVINEYGCMDTLRDLIRVKAPVLDLIVNELLLKLNSNYYESTVNFTNIGNRDIEIINFELEFVNGSTVLEQWSGTLLPSDDDTYIFSSKTKNESISQSDVVCVSAILINDEQDDNPEDNKQCVTLNKEIDLLSPIYDYENKTITIQIISNKEQDILINFYDQLGKVLHKGTVICYEGYNTVEINVARQQAGLYIYTINNDNELIAGKATILN